MKHAPLLSVALLCLGLAISFTNVTASTTFTPGVTTGTIIVYAFTNGASSPVNTTISVTNVSGTIITYQRDNNTTQIPYNVSNVIIYSPWFFVGANLSLSDPMYTGSTLWFVTSTNPSYNIAGKSWNTISMSGTHSGITITATWERATGIMLYWSYASSNINQMYSALAIRHSSTGTIPIDPFLIIATMSAGVVIAIIIVSRKKRLA